MYIHIFPGDSDLIERKKSIGITLVSVFYGKPCSNCIPQTTRRMHRVRKGGKPLVIQIRFLRQTNWTTNRIGNLIEGHTHVPFIVLFERLRQAHTLNQISPLHKWLRIRSELGASSYEKDLINLNFIEEQTSGGGGGDGGLDNVWNQTQAVPCVERGLFMAHRMNQLCTPVAHRPLLSPEYNKEHVADNNAIY